MFFDGPVVVDFCNSTDPPICGASIGATIAEQSILSNYISSVIGMLSGLVNGLADAASVLVYYRDCDRGCCLILSPHPSSAPVFDTKVSSASVYHHGCLTRPLFMALATSTMLCVLPSSFPPATSLRCTLVCLHGLVCTHTVSSQTRSLSMTRHQCL